MKYLKLFESFDEETLYRNTSIQWLMDFLRKGSAKPYGDKRRYISFSKKEDSGGQDTYGDIRIDFNAKELYTQGAIEVEYVTDFFDEHPEICRYVTGYESEDEYYKENGYESAEDYTANNADDADTIPWESNIEDYEAEAEVVIKNLKFKDGLITKVTVPEKLKNTDFDRDFNFMKEKGLTVEFR